MKLIIFLVCISLVLTACGQQTERTLTIGAILPLSGPAAVWGLSTQEGMLLAQEELAAQGKNITIIYEDSQGKPAEGVTAYNKVKENSDVIFTVLSRVTVPILPLSHADKKPLIMTVVSAKDVTLKSKYAFRFYANERGYADPHFAAITREEYPSLAVVYVNDEYGISVATVVREEATKRGIHIVADESFDPGTTDFKTTLLKVKDAQPSGVVVIGATPTDTVGVLKQFREFHINATFIDVSTVLSIKEFRTSDAEGAYTVAFPFTLQQSGAEFREKYIAHYGKEPFFPAAFGYDMVKMVAAASGGKSMDGEELNARLRTLGDIDTANGVVRVQQNGEINPPMYRVKIVDNALVY
jgi:branched-chain amino acid transport system substrate-binding protein